MVGSSRWESVAVSPWPGKCLAHGADARALQAPGVGGDVPGCERRVGTEAADPDHRVAAGWSSRRRRARGSGRPLPRTSSAPMSARDRLGDVHVVQRAEVGRRRVQRALAVVQPGDVAALLVDGDQCCRPAAWMASVSVRSCSGSTMLVPNRHTEPSPAASSAASQSGSTGPSKPGIRVARMARRRSVMLSPSPHRRRARRSGVPARSGRR